MGCQPLWPRAYWNLSYTNLPKVNEKKVMECMPRHRTSTTRKREEIYKSRGLDKALTSFIAPTNIRFIRSIILLLSEYYYKCTYYKSFSTKKNLWFQTWYRHFDTLVFASRIVKITKKHVRTNIPVYKIYRCSNGKLTNSDIARITTQLY